MNCFRRLIECKFLSEATRELQQARDAISQETQSMVEEEEASSTHTVNSPLYYIYGLASSTKRIFYTNCIRQFRLVESMRDTLTEEARQLFFIRIEYLHFFFSRSKSVLESACTYAYNVNGEIPYYKGKHKVGGRVFYTALIDTRFSLVPNSPN